MIMKRYIKYTALILTIIFLFSCATSSGSLYSGIAKTEKSSAPQKNAKGDKTEEPAKTKDNGSSDISESDETGLKIVTDPDNAQIYIDNNYIGSTPFLITDLQQGSYKLTIRKIGYYSKAVWINYNGGLLVYSTDLERITGFLDLSVTPQEASVTLEDNPLSPGMHELPIGSYALNIHLFGYEEYKKEIQIREKEILRVDVKLKKAAFHISDLRVYRTAFNPSNPGLTGKDKICFTVNSWGSGTVTIYNSKNSEVFKRKLNSFTTWDQSLLWDGRDSKDRPLPDGEYRIVLTGKSEDLKIEEEHRISVIIDSSLKIGYRSVWNGSGGLLYAPVADILPVNEFQFSFLLAGHQEAVDNGLFFRFPSALSLRAGLGRGYELSVLGNFIFGNTDTIPAGGSVSIKKQILNTNSFLKFNAGISLKASYQYGTTTDIFTDFTGLTAGFALSAGIGSLSILYSPEIILAPFRVVYPGTLTANNSLGFYTWIYQRAGFLLDLGSFTAGISTAVRTAPFTNFKLIDYPVQAAAEFNWMLPNTHLFISFILAGEFESLESYYLLSGGGVSFVY